jgi:hypothetical protein
VNWLTHLSDMKLRQFRHVVEATFKALPRRYVALAITDKSAFQRLVGDTKVLYTLICFEVARRREAARPTARQLVS